MAMLRPEEASAPLAEIAPLFSTSASPPLLSRMAVAEPLVPPAVALMTPALRIAPTVAPWSIWIAVVCAELAFPPAARTAPEI